MIHFCSQVFSHSRDGIDRLLHVAHQGTDREGNSGSSSCERDQKNAFELGIPMPLSPRPAAAFRDRYIHADWPGGRMDALSSVRPAS